MSFSNKFKTHVLDTHYFDQSRCEFRIPSNKVIASNIRLTDVKCLTSNDAKQFSVNMGAYGLIQRITLFNDNVEVSSLNNVGEWMGFFNTMKSNESYDLNLPLSMANLQITNDNDIHEKLKREDNYPKYYTLSNVSTNLQTSALLDLRPSLQYLLATPVLDTRQMKNVRIVIEWVPLTKRITNDTIVSISKPTLTFDELIDPNDISKVPNKPVVNYVQLDSETIQVSDITSNSTPQLVTQRLRGFDNKSCLRSVMISKSSDTNFNTGVLDGNSMAFLNEKYQLTVNGQKLFPYSGVDSPAKKLAMVEDSWGKQLVCTGLNLPTLVSKGDCLDDSLVKDKQSYFGCKLNTRIDEMQLDYQRTSGSAPMANNEDRLAFDMLVFVETLKQCNANDGRVNVSYL